MKKSNKILVFILLFVIVCTFLISLCGCFDVKPVTYRDDTGLYTIYITHAVVHRIRDNSSSDEPRTYIVPSYVQYNKRNVKVTEINSDSTASTGYGSDYLIDGGKVSRLMIPSTITKIDLSGYRDLSTLDEIDVSANSRFEMVGGALYTKDKRQLLYCLRSFTGTLKIFRRTKSFLDKDGNLDRSGIFNGRHLFENVEVEKGNTWCASKDGALYSKDMSKLLYYSPYKKDLSYTLPKNFSMENPSQLLFQNTHLQNVYVEDGNKHYKSISGVLYSSDGQTMQLYMQNRTATNFVIPSQMTDFIRTNSFMMDENLQSITVDSDNTHFVSADGVLYSRDGKELICYPLAKQDEHFAIPANVKTIGNYAMHNVQNLKTLFIPSSVQLLNSYSVTSNIEYFVEAERSERYLRLEAYGVTVHYGVSLDEYLNIVSGWSE